MATMHIDKDSRDETKNIMVSPLVLERVKVKTTIKEVISPVLIPVDIEKPTFIDKEYERPVLVDKEYERPVLVNKEYERPVVKDKEVERPVIIDKEYERPVLIDKEYERPVIIEKEFPIPVPKEVPYDVPTVSMEQANKIAAELTAVLSEAKATLGGLSKAKDLLVKAIREVKDSIPKEIVVPNIIYEDHTVKNVKIEEETVTVIGKIIARGK